MKNNGISTLLSRLKEDKVLLQNLIKKALIALLVLILAAALVIILIDTADKTSPQAPPTSDKGDDDDGGNENTPTTPPGNNEGETVVYGDALELQLSADSKYYTVVGFADARHTEIVIPDTYDGLPVKAIASYALYQHPYMTSLVIGNNVETIGAYAVSDCSNLKDLTIGNKVQHIGEGAFALSSGLRSVIIPDSTKNIGKGAFYLCDKLVSVTLGEGVTIIGDDAFLRCTKLVEVVNNSSLVLQVSSSSNGYVSKYASYVCRGTSRLDITDGFIFCKMGATDYLIGHDGSTNMLVLPESYNGHGYVIHDYAFYNYHDIISVTIPEGIDTIGEKSFEGCYRLAEVINRSELALTTGTSANGSIARYALSIHNENESRMVVSGDFIFYINGSTPYLVDYLGTDYDLELPEDYNTQRYSINQYAFYMDRGLRTVTMSDNVFSTGSSVFYDCTNLQSVRLSENLSSINAYMFRGCTNLTSITIPAQVTSIGVYAFHCCYKLTEVINHSQLPIALGSKDYGCVGEFAKEIHVDNESRLIRVDDFIFYSGDNVNYLISYVGDSTTLVLPADLNGESYKINAYAFFASNRIRNITVSDNTTAIGKGAFAYCYLLTELTLGTGLDVIEASAFSECTSIRNVFFRGGELELMNITIHNDNSYMLDCVRYYSISAPASPSGYWHYNENGVPVLW